METVPQVPSSPEPTITDSTVPLVDIVNGKCSVVVLLLYVTVMITEVKGSHSYKLSELANLRSGDKGDSANIGMLFRSTMCAHVRTQSTCMPYSSNLL